LTFIVTCSLSIIYSKGVQGWAGYQDSSWCETSFTQWYHLLYTWWQGRLCCSTDGEGRGKHLGDSPINITTDLYSIPLSQTPSIPESLFKLVLPIMQYVW